MESDEILRNRIRNLEKSMQEHKILENDYEFYGAQRRITLLLAPHRYFGPKLST